MRTLTLIEKILLVKGGQNNKIKNYFYSRYSNNNLKGENYVAWIVYYRIPYNVNISNRLWSGLYR